MKWIRTNRSEIWEITNWIPMPAGKKMMAMYSSFNRIFQLHHLDERKRCQPSEAVTATKLTVSILGKSQPREIWEIYKIRLQCGRIRCSINCPDLVTKKGLGDESVKMQLWALSYRKRWCLKVPATMPSQYGGRISKRTRDKRAWISKGKGKYLEM